MGGGVHQSMFRRVYGASPLHLLALIASLLIAGAAIAGWFESFPGPTVVKILEWFLVAIVAHDLVLLPLYSLFDRIAFTGGRSRRAGTPGDHPRATNYVRIPAILSGLLFLVFFPEILRLGDGTFFAASGFHQRVYLVRYLLTCAGLFALAGLAYAFAVARSSRNAAPIARVCWIPSGVAAGRKPISPASSAAAGMNASTK